MLCRTHYAINYHELHQEMCYLVTDSFYRTCPVESSSLRRTLIESDLLYVQRESYISGLISVLDKMIFS